MNLKPLLMSLFIISVSLSPAIHALDIGRADDLEKALKAAAESVIASPDNVTAGSDVEHIWKYSDYLWQKDRRKEAGIYIEAGLTFEPFNYLQQAKLANVLQLSGNNIAARERAEVVWKKSEDAKPVEIAGKILGIKPVKPFPKPAREDFASPTVVLVTISEPCKIVVSELKERVEKYLGLNVVIFSDPFAMPEPDRSFHKSEIRRMRSSILGLEKVKDFLGSIELDVEALNKDDRKFVEAMTAYLEKSSGRQASEEFVKNMENAEKIDRQWLYDNLRDQLIAGLKSFRGKNWLVIGVTDKDIFMKNTNYVFAGTNPYAQGIISYHRFSGKFNNEPQNRQRLGDRLFKQFLSVFGLLNGMRRCTFPDCARVFPRTIAEHDEKPAYLCRDCREALERLLKINIKK